MNCRVLVLQPETKTVLDQIGTPGNCTHDPPNAVGSPNGDTPLSDGNLLVSEINGSWVDEYTTRGSLVWDVQLPIGYPSDPQQIGPDRYLVADYESPGGIVEFNREGQDPLPLPADVGPGEAQPPLIGRASAVRRVPVERRLQRPHGRDRPGNRRAGLAVRRHREPGTAAGLLNTPDGFDILGPGGSTADPSGDGLIRPPVIVWPVAPGEVVKRRCRSD